MLTERSAAAISVVIGKSSDKEIAMKRTSGVVAGLFVLALTIGGCGESGDLAEGAPKGNPGYVPPADQPSMKRVTSSDLAKAKKSSDQAVKDASAAK